MATTYNIEHLTERAFIAALSVSSALSAATIRRWGDQSSATGYPCILVHAENQETGRDAVGYADTVGITISAQTDRRVDTSASTCNNLAAGCRDVVRTGATFVATLNATDGITFLGVRPETGGTTDETGDVHRVDLQLDAMVRMG